MFKAGDFIVCRSNGTRSLIAEIIEAHDRNYSVHCLVLASYGNWLEPPLVNDLILCADCKLMTEDDPDYSHRVPEGGDRRSHPVQGRLTP